MREDPRWEPDLYDRYAEEFLGCDYPGCLGEMCSQHQYKEKHAGRHPAHHLEFIQRELNRQAHEERQFVLNVLDGIDAADEQLGNGTGGTKAIRHALMSRYMRPML